jgi:hypothetical protein
MTVIFLPIGRAFNAATVAGSGTVLQWNYTVPAGKRAILTHAGIRLGISAAAANLIGGTIQCVIGGVAIFVIRLFNQAPLGAEVNSYLMCGIDLAAGDVVQGFSTNNAGAGIVPQVGLFAAIREYQ